MAVDSQHPDYAYALPTWKLVRDVLEGERAIKDKTTEYLPALTEQQTQAYLAYLSRAQFSDIPQQAHKTWVGYIFRKDPVFNHGADLADFMDDATLQGVSFYDWLKDTARAVLGLGRRGTLIEWDDKANRPYLATYSAESIINWKTTKIDNQQVLSLLVLYEQSPLFYDKGEAVPGPGDEFDHLLYEQWRVYRLLFDVGGLPFVMCEVFRRKQSAAQSGQTGALETITLPGTGPTGAVTQGTEQFVSIEQRWPDRGGKALTRIPFVFHGPNNYLATVDCAPLEGIARKAVSAYRTSADLENGLHMSGLPTLWSKGFGENAKDLPVGANVAWVTDKDWAQCGYLEVGGGFDGLQKALERKRGEMIEEAGRVAASDMGPGPEAYDTVKIRETGATVTIGTAAIALTQSGSRVLQWAGWWGNRGAETPEDLAQGYNCEVNTEFIECDVPADKMNAIVAAWKEGAISHKTLFFNFQKGELYEPDSDYDDEVQAIQDDEVQPIGALPAGAMGAQGAAFGGGAAALKPKAKPAEKKKPAAEAA